MTLSEPYFYRSMSNRYSELAGFLPDEASDIAIRLHTLAGELADFSSRLEGLEKQWSPALAEGTALDTLASWRGLKRKEISYARGILSIRRTSNQGDLVIPEGTVCATDDGSLYKTTKTIEFVPLSSFTSAPIQAAMPGAAGNALPGKVHILVSDIPGIMEISNTGAVSGGMERETDLSLRKRLLSNYRMPSNGVNAAYYRDIAENFPGISSAAAFSGDTIGAILLYVAQDGQKELPLEIMEALKIELNTQREFCASVTVKNAIPSIIDLHAFLEPAPGFTFETVKAQIESLLTELVGTLKIGERLLLAGLVKSILESGYVSNCQVCAPAADISPGNTKIIRIGTVTLTQMGG